MRKYKYQHIAKPAPDGVRQKTKLYTIYLGAGARHTFKSLRAAQAYAAEYSRQINKAMHLYNFLLAELYASHRGAWFYYFDKASGKNCMDLEKLIAGLINDIEKELHRAAHFCGGYNTTGNIWQVLQRACEDFVNAFTMLAAFLFARRLYTESEKLKILCCQAINEKSRIAALYGFEIL